MEKSIIPTAIAADQDKKVLSDYDYDVFVIGDTAGGFAFAREAASLGARVGLSQAEARWGADDNIIKALHHAAVTEDNMAGQAETDNSQSENPKNDWQFFQQKANRLISDLHEGYLEIIKKLKIDYFSSKVCFANSHTINIVSSAKSVTAKYVVISTGTLQGPEDVGAFSENVIPSDNFFSLKRRPGKTLVVGSTALAVEYAGILASFGFPTTLLARNILLRGCDPDMVVRVEDCLTQHGVRIIKRSLVAETHQDKEMTGGIKVRIQPIKAGTVVDEVFDTVLVANNRVGATADLKLAVAGIKAGAGGKIRVNDMDQTTVAHIFAIGDVASGRPEFSTPAIKAGQLLARRLFNKGVEKMDYNVFPYVVLSPIEYGYCGETEEGATGAHGHENIEIYHTSFKPVEWELLESRDKSLCYVKLITTKSDQVIRGFHYMGPNATEVAQGFAMALVVKADKKSWDKTLGIHPTCAEVLIGLSTTKAVSPQTKKTSC